MTYNTPKPQLRAFLKKNLLSKNKFIVILSVIVFNISSSISQNTPQGLGVQIGNSIIHSDYGEGRSSDVNALSVSLTPVIFKNDLTTFVIKTFHLELSPLIYFGVNKNSKFLFYRILKYFFRTCAYLLILNFKKSLKNLIKIFSIIYYFIL